ncbi:hypothetical protein J6590_016668 [Homalodisca vitripennis]|nr:hypothetical protein J6590_016668 [Homalodisca vitripennis]
MDTVKVEAEFGTKQVGKKLGPFVPPEPPRPLKKKGPGQENTTEDKPLTEIEWLLLTTVVQPKTSRPLCFHTSYRPSVGNPAVRFLLY